ncbi:glycosyl transferase [Bodo saltans virus]|uniref:Glycosyl transferase n=1 Tax=Bodo saltans virus TaxID=2024608 RepID=A0A2H4UVS3_9VIRU|nr:glycosyl transferase [Bodo saltans virus]ATZ80984.1 glycosyl transferase [Bodo saltans virus]
MTCSITKKQDCKLKKKLRKLFTAHAVFTTFCIDSLLQSSPNLHVNATLLLQNQKDIGNNIKYIIGESNSAQLIDLLTKYICAVATAVTVVRSNDKLKINDAVKNIFTNSQDVSKFLFSLNPSKLPYETVLNEFNEHDQYIIGMTILRSQNQVDKEIMIYDLNYKHMLMFSDMLHNALQVQNDISLNFLHIIIIIIIIIFLYLLYNYIIN